MTAGCGCVVTKGGRLMIAAQFADFDWIRARPRVFGKQD